MIHQNKRVVILIRACARLLGSGIILVQLPSWNATGWTTVSCCDAYSENALERLQNSKAFMQRNERPTLTSQGFQLRSSSSGAELASPLESPGRRRPSGSGKPTGVWRSIAPAEGPHRTANRPPGDGRGGRAAELISHPKVEALPIALLPDTPRRQPTARCWRTKPATRPGRLRRRRSPQARPAMLRRPFWWVSISTPTKIESPRGGFFFFFLKKTRKLGLKPLITEAADEDDGEIPGEEEAVAPFNRCPPSCSSFPASWSLRARRVLAWSRVRSAKNTTGRPRNRSCASLRSSRRRSRESRCRTGLAGMVAHPSRRFAIGDRSGLDRRHRKLPVSELPPHSGQRQVASTCRSKPHLSETD